MKLDMLKSTKTWLQDDLRGVVNPTPHVGREIENVQMRIQIHAYHFQQEWDQTEREF